MAERDDMILPLLREMRAENVALHADAGQRLALMDRRIEALERKVRELEGHR